MRTHTARIGTPGLLAAAALCVFLPTLAQAQVLNLAWDASTTPDQDYRVHVGTTAGANNVLDQWVPNSQTTFAFAATPGVRYYFAVSFVDEAGVDGPWSATVTGGVPTFAQPANQSGVVGTAITPLSMTAVDPDSGALSFTATGLPAGLTINASTGRVTGTPSTTGTNNVTVSLRDGQVLVERSFTWTIAATAVAVVSAVSASPNTGSGVSRRFALVYANSLGASSLASAQATFGASPGATANACAVSYNPSASLVSLLNDAGTSWQSGSIGSGLLQNSQCGIALSGSSASVSGTQLTLNLAVTFGVGYGGTKNIYLHAASTTGPTSGWVSRGSWTVPSEIVAIASSVTSPKPIGTTITFTGTVNGSSSGYQFKWWLFNGATWTIVQDWGAATFAWRPTQANTTHRVGVWARAAGTTADASALNVSIPYAITPSAPLTLTGLTPNLASPQATGTTITFMATASGGSGPYQYKWWLFDGTAWVVSRDWGTGATFAWTPTQARTNYRVGVWVRNAGDTTDNHSVNLSVPYVIAAGSGSGGALRITGLSSNVANPQAGTPVTFTATAAGATGPYQYKWWIFDGTSWSIVQTWGSGSFTWTPPAANSSYRVGVWVRDSTTVADTSQVNLSIPYPVAP